MRIGVILRYKGLKKMHDAFLTIKSAALLAYIPFAALMAYIDVSSESIMVLAALLAIDTATGLEKARRLHNKPTSTRLANGLISKMLLLLIPLVVALAAKGLDVDVGPMVSVVLAVLILSEVYSIIGNIYAINTGKEVEEFDAVSMILKYIRNILNRVLGDMR